VVLFEMLPLVLVQLYVVPTVVVKPSVVLVPRPVVLPAVLVTLPAMLVLLSVLLLLVLRFPLIWCFGRTLLLPMPLPSNLRKNEGKDNFRSDHYNANFSDQRL
jgi:hypothetical protein